MVCPSSHWGRSCRIPAMASSLLALLDDIATVLDDVAILSKVAAKKSAGVLGDDLALNAQQVTGVSADRELPVVWAVAKGSFLNKAILVPAALAIGAFAPWLITPLLMLGGAFLCFEGFEKLAHRFRHSKEEDEAHRAALSAALQDPQVDLVAFERDKIKGAVRTDFILSAEIIAITLGAAAAAPFTTQALVLTSVAIAITAGVYGLVAAAAPLLMKTLGVVGTAAMFLVGGGILVHGVPPLHHGIEHAIAGLPGAVKWLAGTLAEGATGVVAGGVIVAVFTAFQKLRGKKAAAA
jgi:predicted DNA repair protein MutK